MSFFDYNDGSGIVPPNSWRLSPSQASRFFDSTSQWYREMLMGEAPAFTGSTSSVLGTLVHAHAEAYAKNEGIDDEEVENFLSKQPPDIDTNYIREQYPVMVDTLNNSYLQYHLPEKTELFLWHEVLPGIGVGGSIDSIYYPNGTNNLGIIVDYKTTSALNPPDKVPRAYYFQQLLYCYLCKKNGINVDRFRLVFITTNQVNRTSETTGKPLKDYPSTVSTVDHLITSDDWNLIESVADLICGSVDLWNKHPELRWALAQDYRLKSMFKAPPKLFGK
jgi:hypothetical protein